MTPLARIQENLRHLRLHRIQNLLENSLEEASRNNLSYTDFLDQMLSQEVAAKMEKNVSMRTTMARFPFVKTLESFDFAFQPSIDKKKIKELASCRFIANGENIILLGPPGVGKTHLAVALGLKAVSEGYRTYFTQATPLVASLTKAYAENRFEEKLKLYCQSKLLIIDEIGYIPIDRHGAHLFFQLISRRYEKGALILTSNRSFSQWNEIFGDSVIATAILDRILHHSTTVNIKGNSYRLKEKVKAGLIQQPPPNEEPS
ncbi:MAG TPA: IS21-like element helper ATPase IstB [Syntrophales bacterium]|nr:IS21-like element helper ATPase IstB [Syntrophales bacterium]